MRSSRASNQLSAHRPFVDLTRPEYAYLFGLLQTDGHLGEGKGAKGKLTLELNARDAAILPVLQTLFPCYTSVRTRIRSTNFRNGYASSVLTVSDLGTREELKSLGLPVGSKSSDVAPPTVPFVAADYFRGVIDGDGSLGCTARGLPFVSLVTASDRLATAFIEFIKQVTGLHKTASRNRRDQVFNLSVFREPAQQLASAMYYPDCLAIPRKKALAMEVIDWKRPDTMRFGPERRTWTPEEDAYLMTHSVTESVAALKRTKKSVGIRQWRLRTGRVSA